MVYDTQSKRAILFGGSNGYTAETLNDTWAYDFEANRWTEMKAMFPAFRVGQMPYRGVKESGLGREGLRYSIEDMTERKLMVMAVR